MDTGNTIPILKGFPKAFDQHDELYWPLVGDQSKITTLLTAQGSKGMGQRDRYPEDGPPELDGKQWPVAWTKEVGKGTGLGLSLVRELAEGMGGSLSLAAASDETTGAAFALRLPAGEARVDARPGTGRVAADESALTGGERA